MRKIIYLILILIIFSNVSFASDSNDKDLKVFLNDMKEYTNEVFPELEPETLIENIKSGKLLDKKTFFEKILNIFLDELKENKNLIFNIIIVSLLCGIIKNLQVSSNSETSEIAFYICYIFVVTLLISSYTNLVAVTKSAVSKLSIFMNGLIIIILSFLAINGSIVSVGILKPILLGMTVIINVVITKIILPINLISLVLGIVGNISNSISVSKIPRQLQKISTWCLEILIIVFTGILSLDGTLSANVDGLTAKVTKTVVSTTIPVVRKST